MSEDQIPSSDDPLAKFTTEDLLESLGHATYEAADMSGSEWKRGYSVNAERIGLYLQLRLLHRISDSLDALVLLEGRR